MSAQTGEEQASEPVVLFLHLAQQGLSRWSMCADSVVAAGVAIFDPELIQANR